VQRTRLLWLTLGFRMWTSFAVAMERHRDFGQGGPERLTLYWMLIGNAWDMVLAFGPLPVALAIAWLVAGLRRWRLGYTLPAEVRRPLIGIAGIALLTLSGTVAAETMRIFLFAGPFVFEAAARGFDRWGRPRPIHWAMLGLLQAAWFFALTTWVRFV
jgi:hypothetical protein